MSMLSDGRRPTPDVDATLRRGRDPTNRSSFGIRRARGV